MNPKRHLRARAAQPKELGDSWASCSRAGKDSGCWAEDQAQAGALAAGGLPEMTISLFIHLFIHL